LDAWLIKPKDLVRKTKMIFPGLKKEEDRANLIAYLKENGNN
jgi:cytochrome c